MHKIVITVVTAICYRLICQIIASFYCTTRKEYFLCNNFMKANMKPRVNNCAAQRYYFDMQSFLAALKY